MFWALTALSCNPNSDKNSDKIKLDHNIIDTINIDGHYRNFAKRFDSGEKVVELKIFNKKMSQVTSLVQGDTFFLQLYFKSTFSDELNKNQHFEVFPVNDDFIFENNQQNKNSQIMLITKPNADSVIFDVYLKSKNHVFKESIFPKNGVREYKYSNFIGLCRFKELVE